MCSCCAPTPRDACGCCSRSTRRTTTSCADTRPSKCAAGAIVKRSSWTIAKARAWCSPPGPPRRSSSTSLCAATTGTTGCSTRARRARSEEHTSELQSPCNLVCRLLLEKKKIIHFHYHLQKQKKKKQI